MAVSFQTNKLKSRREAIIDGHKYIVRQYGNIERLEVMRLQDEIQEIIDKYPEGTLDKDMKKDDLNAMYSKSIQASETLYSLFDDGTESQELSRKLVASLDEEDIIQIITDIFVQTEVKENDKA